MKKKRNWLRLIAVLGILLLMQLMFAPEAGTASAGNTTYGGQATAVRANVLGINTTISDTGKLSSGGGNKENSLLTATVPNLLTAQVLHAATVAQGGSSRSEASVANLNLAVGGHTIRASFVMARASATCSNGGTVTGNSHIVGLTIDNHSYQVGTSPNTTIPLLNGKVVLNEQTSKSGSITVNAVHVVINGIADVVVSSAHASVACGRSACAPGDFITSGGWTTGTPTGGKGNFGIAGGIKNGGLWGHLLYHDKNNDLKVKGTSVTSYTTTGTNSRRVKGTCQINGQNGFTYQVDLTDNGEPGRNDTVQLQLSNGYNANGTLAGGNVQLHKKTCK